MDCLFCQIARGEIPSEKVYEDEHVFAFRDIHPQAPVHILIVPKAHMRNILECEEREDGLLGILFATAAQLAKQAGLAQSGFRVVTNCGRDGAQSVDHFHLLGGKQLSERMS
ncbi:MAG: histidine triad nucleotide-binding protein [Clostridia bacterium]